MIFADKLILLRKKAGWSQEELAEQMDVTRQSVSKWESAQSVPDLEKMIRLSDLFHVSTDYLLKDEIENVESLSSSDDTPQVKRVSMEDANGDVQQCVQIQKKLYIVDVNKRKLSAFDEFAIEMFSKSNQGEADLITGIKKCNTKVKVPVCILYGVTKGFWGMNKQITLGYYASLEDAKKELNNISKASTTGTVYELKYAAKMQGVRIVDKEKE